MISWCGSEEDDDNEKKLEVLRKMIRKTTGKF